MCSLQQWYANQYPRCPFVQAMTSRVTGSSRGTAESGRAWPACCPAGTRTTSFPSRVTIPRLPSCILHDLLREVLDDDFLLQTHIFFALPCLSLPASLFFVLQGIGIIHVWNKHLALPPAASGRTGGSFAERLKQTGIFILSRKQLYRFCSLFLTVYLHLCFTGQRHAGVCREAETLLPRSLPERVSYTG